MKKHVAILLHICIFMPFILMINGCAQNDGFVLSDYKFLPEPEHDYIENPDPQSPEQKQTNTIIQTLSPVTEVSTGIDQGSGQLEQQLAAAKNKVTINADAMAMSHFIHLALGEVLQLSYTLDKSLETRKETVSLHVNQPVAVEKMYTMVEEVLDLYDISIVSGSEGLLRVIPQSKLRNSAPQARKTRVKALMSLGRVIELMPLYYTNAGDAMAFFRHYVSAAEGGDVLVNERLNALVVIGSSNNIEKYRAAVELIDQPQLSAKYLRLIKPVYWQASAMREVLAKTLQAQGIPVTNSDDGITAGKGLKLIPVPEINALILAAPKKQWLNNALSLVKQLDTAEALGDESQYFVYFVRNARADDLGNSIKEALGYSVSIERKTEETITGTEVATENNQAPGDEKAVTTSTSIGVSNNLRVIVDETRNALIFVGTAADYRRIKGLLDHLDRQPRQVLIEAVVADVTLDDDTQLGVEWAASFGLGDGRTAEAGTLGGLNVGNNGLTVNVLNSVGDIRATLNAYAKNNKIRVLSSPKLLARDNEEARIQVGEQLQIVSSESQGADAPTGDIVRTFKSVETGVILEIRPTINEGGLIQLEIMQEVSKAQDTSDSPTISKRVVTTNIIIKSGETILIGGIIDHFEETTTEKVPLVGDIPVLGHLFKTNSIKETSKEMVVLITPHIVNNSEDARFLTKAFRDALEHPDWSVPVQNQLKKQQ